LNEGWEDFAHRESGARVNVCGTKLLGKILHLVQQADFVVKRTGQPCLLFSKEPAAKRETLCRIETTANLRLFPVIVLFPSDENDVAIVEPNHRLDSLRIRVVVRAVIPRVANSFNLVNSEIPKGELEVFTAYTR